MTGTDPLNSTMTVVNSSPQMPVQVHPAPLAPKSLTDEHAVPQHHITHVQVTLLFVYTIIVLFWATRFICSVFNIRIFNNLPGFGIGSHSKTAQQTAKEHAGETAMILSTSPSSSITIVDDVKNSKIDKFHNQYERLLEGNIKNAHNEGDKSLFSNQDENASSESRDANQREASAGHSSTIVSVGHNGITENLSERHFSSANKSSDKDSNAASGVSSVASAATLRDSTTSTSTSAAASGGGPPPVTLDKFLCSFTLFGCIMIFFYFCDYWKMFPQGPRAYSRDVFCFLVFLFFLVAIAFTIKDNQDKVLNRDQTEEWKGWMQVMFVWYHYFKAAEWYNWIRVYIACYVWMTGFGNFSFFWIRKDFSMWRMLKMLFRLNFLVIFVAMVTNNEYMLYYICAMHTYWFLTVYIFMRVLNSWNTDPLKMAVKFAAYAVCNAIIFDVPGVSQTIFRPIHFILGYHDYHNKYDIMHEWAFRAGLDHWACFIGMLCAYNYPHFETFMNYLDSKSISNKDHMKKVAIRSGLGFGALLIGVLWNATFMGKDKYSYNAIHPYTSGIPILVFIVLRNIHPSIRSKHIAMFSWLGKITLETYLSQLHVYLLSNARTLLVYLPNYPLLNFALATIVYLTLSHLLFNITTDASNFLIPRDRKRLFVHIVCIAAIFGLASAVSYGIVF